MAKRKAMRSIPVTTTTTPGVTVGTHTHNSVTAPASNRHRSLLVCGLQVRAVKRSLRSPRNRVLATRPSMRAEEQPRCLNDSEGRRRLPAAPRGDVFPRRHQPSTDTQSIYGASKKKKSKPARREAPLRTVREDGGASGEARERRRSRKRNGPALYCTSGAKQNATRQRGEEEEPLPRKVELVKYSLPMLFLSSSSSGLRPLCASSSSPSPPSSSTKPLRRGFTNLCVHLCTTEKRNTLSRSGYRETPRE
ncbi:hypothetical protein MRX96_028553 [Rhipicephalus microplus]